MTKNKSYVTPIYVRKKINKLQVKFELKQSLKF